MGIVHNTTTVIRKLIGSLRYVSNRVGLFRVGGFFVLSDLLTLFWISNYQKIAA